MVRGDERIDKMTKHATILIVEDDQPLNKAYQMILSSAGHEVLSAFNGKEALDVLSKQDKEPDIIFLDLQMPLMNGINFLKKYNAPSHKNTVVILFSNYDAQKEVDAAYELGAERYVLKARAAPKELLRIVDDIIANRKSKTKE